jgi:peptidoglycan DL-endopeptidase LytE
MTTGQQKQVVSLARSLLGKPYKYGAVPEEAPDIFDCSSFTQYVLKDVGIDIPRVSLYQAADTKGKEIVPAPDYSNLEPGDLIFTRGKLGRYDDNAFDGRKISVGHVAMFAGNGAIIHSRKRLGGVTEQSLADLIAEPNYDIVLVKRF